MQPTPLTATQAQRVLDDIREDDMIPPFDWTSTPLWTGDNTAVLPVKPHTFHSIRIEASSEGIYSRVWMDGKEVQGVTEVRVDINMTEQTKVTLTLIPEELIVEGHPGVVEIERMQNYE